MANSKIIPAESDANTIRCAIWGKGSGNTYSIKETVHIHDTNFFTYDSGRFTFLKPGTYRIVFFGRGGYNSGGNTINLRYRIIRTHNGTNTTLASATNVANVGTNGTIDQEFEVGDILYAETSNASNSSNTHDFGYYVRRLTV